MAPPLCTGLTQAIFSELGKIPVENDVDEANCHMPEFWNNMIWNDQSLHDAGYCWPCGSIWDKKSPILSFVWAKWDSCWSVDAFHCIHQHACRLSMRSMPEYWQNVIWTWKQSKFVYLVHDDSITLIGQKISNSFIISGWMWLMLKCICIAMYDVDVTYLSMRPCPWMCVFFSIIWSEVCAVHVDTMD